jgi:glycerol-3-phosphate acyltransferase PlsY
VAELAIAGALVASYVIGSFPTSYVVCRTVKGIDLREHGSRNLGATNLFRVLGWRFAAPVGLIDMAKGFIPTAFIGPAVSDSVLVALLCGVAAVLGHMFSPWVGFRGGKGVATGAGIFVALAPLAVLAAFALWAVLVFLTGYVSLGSIVGAAVLPFLTLWLYPGQPTVLWMEVALAAMIIWMHRANVGRLLKGTENRFGKRAPQTGGES